MRNVCGRKKVESPVRLSLCLLLILGFIAGVVVNAAADYVPPNTEPPTKADLLLIGGKSKTVVIQLLNLSPYTITQDVSHITALDSLDKNRDTGKKSMFAPVGWPGTLPGLKGTFLQPDTKTNTWVFKPDDTNTTVHPYSFVAAWDDFGGYVEHSTMGWMINNVYTDTQGTLTHNVPLRFWFTRVKPPGALQSSTFKLICDYIKEFVSIIGVMAFPIPPMWVHAFTATAELADDMYKTLNTQDTGGDKMYFSAYVAPDTCSNCITPTVLSSTSTTDGVDVQWATGADEWAANVVVTTHLLRGKDNGLEGFRDGRVPIVNVTVWDAGSYIWAKTHVLTASTKNTLGKSLNAALGKPELSEYTRFAFLYKSLNPSQRQTFHETLEQFRLGNPLTQQQEQLSKKFIAALEKGQTKLSPANR
jgi:hypothetical protein